MPYQFRISRSQHTPRPGGERDEHVAARPGLTAHADGFAAAGRRVRLPDAGLPRYAPDFAVLRVPLEDVRPGDAVRRWFIARDQQVYAVRHPPWLLVGAAAGGEECRERPARRWKRVEGGDIEWI